MVQTRAGAAKNPWIRHLKGCAKSYHTEKAERATLPRRRLSEKSPEASMYVRPRAPDATEPPRPALPQRQAPALPQRQAPAPSIGAGASEAAPRPAISREDAAPLMKFAVTGRNYLRKLPDGRTTAARFAQELGTRGNLKEALKEAGLPAKTAIASFVKVFPDFRVEVPPNGGTAYVSLRK